MASTSKNGTPATVKEAVQAVKDIIKTMSAREVELMCMVAHCPKGVNQRGEPMIDYDKLAIIGEFINRGSAAATYNPTRKKLKAACDAVFACFHDGDEAVASTAAPTPASGKGKGKGKATPKPKPKPKPKTTRKGKQSEQITFADADFDDPNYEDPSLGGVNDVATASTPTPVKGKAKATRKRKQSELQLTTPANANPDGPINDDSPFKYVPFPQIPDGADDPNVIGDPNTPSRLTRQTKRTRLSALSPATKKQKKTAGKVKEEEENLLTVESLQGRDAGEEYETSGPNLGPTYHQHSHGEDSAVPAGFEPHGYEYAGPAYVPPEENHFREHFEAIYSSPSYTSPGHPYMAPNFEFGTGNDGEDEI
ncbi:hypothetical protein HD806DRAFT_543982 [Xylariaceae sp. AK1471]|nr:hypothetical protein HD806DRAFT_543982 [Xylariaceae sp. AK1471]